MCKFLVFQNLYRTILNIFEDTLLILVSKDLYKLQILKVKGKQVVSFSCHKSKGYTIFYLLFTICHTYISFKYLAAENFSLPFRMCHYLPNKITFFYLNYRDTILRSQFWENGNRHLRSQGLCSNVRENTIQGSRTYDDWPKPPSGPPNNEPYFDNIYMHVLP